MAKGYAVQEIKQKLVDVLTSSKTGLSGIEISEKLGVNRVTMTKYLNIFATEGLIGVNLWPLNSELCYLLVPRSMFFEFIPLEHTHEEQPKVFERAILFLTFKQRNVTYFRINITAQKERP